MYYSVDRIEEHTVILIGADGSRLAAHCGQFERVPSEGDIVIPCDGSFTIDTAATRDKREQANALLRQLMSQKEAQDDKQARQADPIGDDAEAEAD